jgi:hypothetical protein
MSQAFSRGELIGMRDVQEAHMMDLCLIAEPTISTDADNVPEESFSWPSAVVSQCGFNASPSKELLDQVPSSEAVVRLPIDTEISNGARVRITKRFGETQAAPITYGVIGMPKLGPSGLMVWLTKITDGSDA